MRDVFAACDMTKPAFLAGQAPDTVLGQNGGGMAPGSRGGWGVRHLYEWKKIFGDTWSVSAGAGGGNGD